MNCFEAHQVAMDLLDGSLPESLRAESELHRDQCETCRTRMDRFQHLRTAISRQPWKPLPASLRTTSPTAAEAAAREDFRTRQQAWKSTPRFMRTGVEGIAIACGILSLIWVIPRVQSVYQWAQAQRLAELFDSDTLFPNASELASKPPKAPQSRATPTDSQPSDDFSEESDVVSEEEGSDAISGATENAELVGANSKGVAVKEQEVWRFNLRAASLADAEENIQKMLKAPAGPLAETDIPSAFHAPGGIQFDLILQPKWINPLQENLKTYAQKNRKSTEATGRESSTSTGTGLVWFRNRSKTQLPSGKSRVIIWVSQY